jgi:hypothetical protein
MLRPFRDDSRFAHPPDLDRRGNAARGPAKDHDVGFYDVCVRAHGAGNEDGGKEYGEGEFHKPLHRTSRDGRTASKSAPIFNGAFSQIGRHSERREERTQSKTPVAYDRL